VEMEQKYKIDVLFAVETGSRVWGGATTQSDYDIRFIFKNRHIRDYLSLEKALETLDFPAPYDAQGWDIFKSFYLFEKSNSSLLEWAVSPIIYRDQNDFSQRLKRLIEESYSLFALYQHYIHLMARNLKEIHHKEFNEKRQKQLIQAIRSFLLAHEIVMNRKIPFDHLYSSFATAACDEVVSFYHLLLDTKRNGSLENEGKAEELISTMERKRAWLDQKASELPHGSEIRNKLNDWIWDLLYI